MLHSVESRNVNGKRKILQKGIIPYLKRQGHSRGKGLKNHEVQLRYAAPSQKSKPRPPKYEAEIGY
jgi:hypothetical protein